MSATPFQRDPAELIAWLSANPGRGLEEALLGTLTDGEREPLRKAATLRGLDAETWRRLGGDDPSFEALQRSPLVLSAADARISIGRPYARLLLQGQTPPTVDALDATGLDRLYHQMITAPEAAAAELRAEADGLLAAADFVGIEARLRLVAELPVTPARALVAAAAELQRRYNTAVLWRWQALNTRVYFERQITAALLEALKQPTPWLFQLRASGGMGKTMFVQHTLGHVLGPAGVPCAHVDFDHVADRGLALREPWRLLIHAAEQLDRQLQASPFKQVLASWRRANAVRVPPGTVSETSSSLVDGDAVRGLFPALLREALQGERAVIFLDTLEVAVHAGDSLSPLLEMLAGLRRELPTLKVVITGRFDLRQTELSAESSALLADPTQAWFGELDLFTPEESDALLLALGVKNRRARGRIHRITAGSPWLLARFAGRGGQQAALAAKNLDDLHTRFTVERVLSRLDHKVQWAVLYASVLRRFGRRELEEVLAPLIEAGLIGNRRQTTNKGKSLADAYMPPSATPPDPLFAPVHIQLDTGWIWAELRRYVKEASWIVEGSDGYLQIDDEVARPLQLVAELDRAADADPRDPTGLLAAAARHWDAREGELATREALWARWRRDAQAAFDWAEARWAEAGLALAGELSAELLTRNEDALKRAATLKQAAPRSLIHGVPPALLARAALSIVQHELRNWYTVPYLTATAETLKALLGREDAVRAVREGRVPGFAAASLALLQAGLRLWAGSDIGGAEAALAEIPEAELDAAERLDLLYWRGNARRRLGQPASAWLQAAYEAAASDPRRLEIAWVLAISLEREGRLLEALGVAQTFGAEQPDDALAMQVRLLVATGQVDEAVAVADRWLVRRGARDAVNQEAWPVLAEVVAAAGVIPWPPFEAELRRMRTAVPRPLDAPTVRMMVARHDHARARLALADEPGMAHAVALLARSTLHDERAPAELEKLPLPSDGSAEALRVAARREAGQDIDKEALALARRELDRSDPAPARAARLIDALFIAPDPGPLVQALTRQLADIPTLAWRLALTEGCAHLPDALLHAPELLGLFTGELPPGARQSNTLARVRLAHLHRVFGDKADGAAALEPLLQAEPDQLALRLRVRRAARACGRAPSPLPFPTALPTDPLDELFWLFEAEARVGTEPGPIFELAEAMSSKGGRRARWMHVALRALVAQGRDDRLTERTAQVASALERAGRVTDARALVASPVRPRRDEWVFTLMDPFQATLNGTPRSAPPAFSRLVSGGAKLDRAVVEIASSLGKDQNAVQAALGEWFADAPPTGDHTVRVEAPDLLLSALPWELMAPPWGTPTVYRHRGTLPPRKDAVKLARALVGEANRLEALSFRSVEGPLPFEAAGLRAVTRWGPGSAGRDVAAVIGAESDASVIHLELAFDTYSSQIFGQLHDGRIDDERLLSPALLADALQDRPHLVLIETLASRVRTETARQLLLRNAFAHQVATALPPDGAAILCLTYADEDEREHHLPALLGQLREGLTTLDLFRRCRDLASEDPLGPRAAALFTGQPDREVRS